MTAPTSQPIPLPIISKPGIQKDGTGYRANACIDGQWVRFKHEWPQKMLGFERVLRGNDELVSNMFEIPRSESTDVYMGRADSLTYFNITNDGIIGPEVDRTPANFAADYGNINNSWSFCTFSLIDADTQLTQQYIFAQVSPDRNNVSLQAQGAVFFGNINDTARLDILTLSPSDPTPVVCSGSIVAFPPVLVALNNNGCIFFSQPNDPFTWKDTTGVINSKFVGNTKCIAGLSYQGSLLIWTLNELIRAFYVESSTPGIGTFSSSTVMYGTTILSPESVVSYQNLVFWVGVGQFYVFNGSVQILPNDMNHDFFFERLNLRHKSKVWAFANPQFDEIVFFFPATNITDPSMNATECDQSVTLHVGKQVWWNNAWARSSGLTLSTYDHPIMASSLLETSLNVSGQPVQTFPIWQHEKGLNKVVAGIPQPILSFIQYPMVDLFTHSPSAETNRLIITQRIEQDFILKGPMQVSIYNFNFPQSQPDIVGPITFTSSDPYIDDIVSQGRIVSVLFSSNVIDGYFAGGKPLQSIILGSFNPQ